MIKTIYREVMLENIIYGVKNDIKFKFYSAETGEDLNAIVCKGIILFQYSSALSLEEESLPHFTLDVTVEDMDFPQTINCLEKNNFSFKENGKPFIPHNNIYFIFKIQGGPIDILVVCQEL